MLFRYKSLSTLFITIKQITDGSAVNYNLPEYILNFALIFK